ncbi:hypothetical protein DL98DRAFT_510842, partial [Cadophora sp. DSE1049]
MFMESIADLLDRLAVDPNLLSDASYQAIKVTISRLRSDHPRGNWDISRDDRKCSATLEPEGPSCNKRSHVTLVDIVVKIEFKVDLTQISSAPKWCSHEFRLLETAVPYFGCLVESRVDPASQATDLDVQCSDDLKFSLNPIAKVVTPPQLH